MKQGIIQSAHCYVIPYDSGFAPNPFHGICTLTTCKPDIRLGVAKEVMDSFLHTIGRDNKKAKHPANEFPDSGFIKEQGIWVIGIAGNLMCRRMKRGSYGKILYMMQVTDVMPYEEYWHEHPEKRPVSLSSDYIFHPNPKEEDYAALGDNIYESKSSPPLYSPHYEHGKENTEDTKNQIQRDWRGTYSLLSDNFVYFGNDAIENPFNKPLVVGVGRPVFKRGTSHQHERMFLNDDVILDQLEEAISQLYDLRKLPGRVGFPEEKRKIMYY